jgi:hypothetical protein
MLGMSKIRSPLRNKAYSRFIRHMEGWVLGLPDADILRSMLELRLTADEAAFLADLPFLPHALEWNGQHIGPRDFNGEGFFLAEINLPARQPPRGVRPC